MPNGPRVLVADDDPIARRFLESALSKAGYEATAVSTGDAAWQVLSKQSGGPDHRGPRLDDARSHRGRALREGPRGQPAGAALSDRADVERRDRGRRGGAPGRRRRSHHEALRDRRAASASRGRGADRHAPGAAHRESPLARGGAGPRAAAPGAHSHLRLVPPGAQRRDLLGAGGQLPDQALGAAVHPRHLPHLPGPGSVAQFRDSHST